MNNRRAARSREEFILLAIKQKKGQLFFNSTLKLTECVQAFILVILTILQKFGVTKQNVEAVVALHRDVKRQTGNYRNWKWNSKLLCNLPVGIGKQSRRCSRRCCKWQENEKTGEKYQRNRRTCRHFPGVYLQSQYLHDVISYLKVRQVKIYNHVIVDSSAFQNISDNFSKFLQT